MNYKPKRNYYNRQPKMPTEEYAQLKSEERQWAYDTVDNALSEMKSDSGLLIDYLNMQAQFDRYSVANAILLLNQKPEATQVKDYKGWKALKVKLNEGAEKLKIFEPSTFIGQEGQEVTSQNIKYVYDISDTNSKWQSEPLPNNASVLMEALLNTTPIDYRAVDEIPNNHCAFFDSQDNTLLIKAGTGNETKLFQEIAKELSLAEIAYNSDDDYNRMECEYSAECSAYMLCRKYGIDTRGLNVTRMPREWENLENKDIRIYLTMAKDSVNTLSYRIYKDLNRDKETRNQDREAR